MSNQNKIFNNSSNIKFNFKRNKDPDMCYKPLPVEFTYYQICQFPNQVTGKYGVRRLKLNEHYDIIETKEKDYIKKKINKFIERIPINKYFTYPTYSISMVALPRPDQLIGANSELLK
jgi:hypothetical protein